METNTASAQDKTETLHQYVEVGNDLLAKPDALADLLLVRGMPSCVIFCNSPSEADMVEVMLKKKGIACAKLIGNVPFQRVFEEVQRIQSREITGLIITDVAARELEVEGFELVVNYGIHEDPEIYLHRITGYETAASLKEVLSLVSPLDFGNFHYLKKVVSFDFTKTELPSSAKLAEAQSATLFNKAQSGPHLENEAVQSLLQKLLDHPQRDNIIAMLLYNTITVLPKLQDESGSRDNRGNNRRNARNEDSGRARHGNDRRNDRDRGGDREDRGGYEERGPRHERQDRRDLPPPAKDARIYIGQGACHNISNGDIQALVKEAGLDPEATLKRISIRECYTFIDVPEEMAEDLLAKLDTVEMKSEAVFARKATLINVPREEQPASSSEEEAQPHFDQDSDDDSYNAEDDDGDSDE